MHFLVGFQQVYKAIQKRYAKYNNNEDKQNGFFYATLLGVFKIFMKIIVQKNSILFHKRTVFVLPTGGYLNSNEIITAVSPDSISYSNLLC